MILNNMWTKIQNSPDPLKKFRTKGKIKACVYPEPYQGIAEAVRWFYSRNNHCQVFFACSQEVSDLIDADSWADVSYEFTIYVEHSLMPFCVENTDWDKCERHGIEYPKGCEDYICPCKPFGEGDFTYGIAEEIEFNLSS